MESISPGIVLGVGAAVGALLFLVGFMLGLWVGERGRRIDLQWWTGLQRAPSSAEERGVELEEARSPDLEALQRAEIAAVAAGLREELVASGRPVPSEEALRLEALRMVSQYQVEPTEELG